MSGESEEQLGGPQVRGTCAGGRMLAKSQKTQGHCKDLGLFRE